MAPFSPEHLAFAEMLLTCDREMRCHAATIDACEGISTNEACQDLKEDKATPELPKISFEVR